MKRMQKKTILKRLAKTTLLTLMLTAVALGSALANAVPYLERITNADQPVFAAPGYEEFVVATVEESGVYTIVEEQLDWEGNLWGRLKSGLGWVDLTSVRAFEMKAEPVSAGYLAEGMLPAGQYQLCMTEPTEYMSALIFHAYRPLTDVRLLSLALTDEGFGMDQVLCSMQTWTPQTPLIACVTFYGDMTSFGLCFRDGDAGMRHYIAYVSGRNGMLVLEPCAPFGDCCAEWQ